MPPTQFPGQPPAAPPQPASPYGAPGGYNPQTPPTQPGWGAPGGPGQGGSGFGGFPPPPPGGDGGKKKGLVIGLVALIVALIAGLGVGAFLIFGGDDDDKRADDDKSSQLSGDDSDDEESDDEESDSPAADPNEITEQYYDAYFASDCTTVEELTTAEYFELRFVDAASCPDEIGDAVDADLEYDFEEAEVDGSDATSFATVETGGLLEPFTIDVSLVADGDTWLVSDVVEDLDPDGDGDDGGTDPQVGGDPTAQLQSLGEQYYDAFFASDCDTLQAISTPDWFEERWKGVQGCPGEVGDPVDSDLSYTWRTPVDLGGSYQMKGKVTTDAGTDFKVDFTFVQDGSSWLVERATSS